MTCDLHLIDLLKKILIAPNDAAPHATPFNPTANTWKLVDDVIRKRYYEHSNENPTVDKSLLHCTNYHWIITNREDEPEDGKSISTISNLSEFDNLSHTSFNFDEQGTTEKVTNLQNNKCSNLSPIEHSSEIEEALEDEVRKLVTGTSQKFVPKPNANTVISNALESLNRFRNTIRMKEQYRNQRIQAQQEKQLNSTESTSTSTSTPPPIPSRPEGLKTNLRPPRKSYTTPRGSDDLEKFFKDLEKEVLDMAWNYRNNTETDPISSKIENLRTKLRNNPNFVVIPTDKTNSFKVLPTKIYISEVQKQLQKHGKPITHTDLTRIQGEAKKLLRKVAPLLSQDEIRYVEYSINSYAIPTPKLLIKDHKKIDPNTDRYPTRLICPANNFVSAFPKLGYLGIKQIFEDNQINYTPFTIIQASDLKSQLEKLKINSTHHTIISVDAKDFYPSVRFKLVKKAINYFSKTLPMSHKPTIEACLKLIQFGMKSTFLNFQERYYEYDGNQDPENRGLTIGGYESAWLADLVGAYVLLECQEQFNSTIYKGMYRDDGLAVFPTRLTQEEIVSWRNEFQTRVNEIAEGDYLQYTCEIWADPVTQPMRESKDKRVTICHASTFPYLDMEFSWNKDKELIFNVHLKPNQRLQYLNDGSAHTSHCFKAIPKSVCQRLAKLTTCTNMNANTPLKHLYPAHFNALKQAGLLNKRTMLRLPTLREAQDLFQAKDPTNKTIKQRERDARRTAYFVIGQSLAWTTPIGIIIKKLKAKHNLNWLRTTVSYQRFNNLRELFNSDVTTKLNANVISKDFASLPCNCKNRNTTGCNYNDVCRERMIVYRVECKTTGKSYIGCTQNTLKKRMQGHFNDIRMLRKGHHRSDSYARHFALMTQNFQDPSPKLIRNMSTFHIIWQGNPLSTVKTFGTPHCILCQQERLNIFKWRKTKPSKIINTCNELYGACRHKSRFHRLSSSQKSSTDESFMDEKVPCFAEV